MTTLELVVQLAYADLACKAGLVFAEAHPDPLDAIEVALANAAANPKREFGHPEGSDGGAFLRWAASDSAVLSEKEYRALGNWRDPDHASRCAEVLREWVRGKLKQGGES